ncbi:rCG32118 [Rattus norvegicus]|uniref:RCG32118 n=1 Tax=Rattus norvegicus TaxID=10116 RepID=A6JXJ5_RAT|nr:rCG32118 [Rattus norvegicus]
MTGTWEMALNCVGTKLCLPPKVILICEALTLKWSQL